VPRASRSILPLGAEEIDRIIEVNEARLRQYGRIGATQLRGVIEAARSAGYSINDEIVLPGIRAVGAPIPTRGGTPYAAISVAGISARFGDERREEIARLLLKETQLLAHRLDEGSATWA
jgi:DNA-binding IclR family transcriptional regulator